MFKENLNTVLGTIIGVIAFKYFSGRNSNIKPQGKIIDNTLVDREKLKELFLTMPIENQSLIDFANSSVFIERVNRLSQEDLDYLISELSKKEDTLNRQVRTILGKLEYVKLN